MNTRPDDPQPVTTALSTLAARVAVLERWMRRSQRNQIALLVVVLFAIVVCVVLLSTR
jgi:hypothetical protein